jgi:hypothetical protein
MHILGRISRTWYGLLTIVEHTARYLPPVTGSKLPDRYVAEFALSQSQVLAQSYTYGEEHKEIKNPETTNKYLLKTLNIEYKREKIIIII